MLGHNPVADGQSQTRAMGLAEGHERLEHLRQHFRGDSWSIVGQFGDNLPLGEFKADPDHRILLARDGIDEMLAILLSESPLDGSLAADSYPGGATVALADVTIAGVPSDVLLWLWGRLPDDAVALSGEPDAIAAVKAGLRDATQ